MSFVSSILIPLLTVAATLGSGWFVTTRVTDHWDSVKKAREMDLAAAQEFQQLYGEFVAVWKLWNILKGRDGHKLRDQAEDPVWKCLERAVSTEGAVEALLAKLVAERRLDPVQIEILGAVRQAFKTLRRCISADERLGWDYDSHPHYVSFKILTTETSVLLNTPRGTGPGPTSAEAARAFRSITENRHEPRPLGTNPWYEAPGRLKLRSAGEG
ncbi:hypothetical protein [Actinocorallia sp. A-T 12471]|uniref:hypothetical protein n=1 Tax=Actinocorallia sp. A-T 12471 TaxID=3089813 RepID=UPI0029D03448|nr:hypothetical protein [Actinocorallia sp. A-T 12471]MDX6740669.1 hypothetical protein [Actinocorallia sp. A-T 12471]